MKIFCKSKSQSVKKGKPKSLQPVIPAGQLVNKVGKYIYKHLDGAFKYKVTGNTNDVYITVLYAIPANLVKKFNLTEDKYKDVHEMTLDLNITTYSNKIRVNIIEISPEEKTIGYDLYPPEKLQDLLQARELIFDKVKKRICKEYEDWDFIF